MRLYYICQSYYIICIEPLRTIWIWMGKKLKILNINISVHWFCYSDYFYMCCVNIYHMFVKCLLIFASCGMCNIFVIWEVCVQKNVTKWMTYGTCILPLLINLVNHLEIFSKVKRDKIYNLCFCHNEKLKFNSYEMSLSYYEKCN